MKIGALAFEILSHFYIKMLYNKNDKIHKSTVAVKKSIKLYKERKFKGGENE